MVRGIDTSIEEGKEDVSSSSVATDEDGCTGCSGSTGSTGCTDCTDCGGRCERLDCWDDTGTGGGTASSLAGWLGKGMVVVAVEEESLGSALGLLPAFGGTGRSRKARNQSGNNASAGQGGACSFVLGNGQVPAIGSPPPAIANCVG